MQKLGFAYWGAVPLLSGSPLAEQQFPILCKLLLLLETAVWLHR